MLATLSIRTAESPAVCETSLPALLNVAWSLPKPLPPEAEELFDCCCALEGAAAGVPNKDFNPSKLLRMSISDYSLSQIRNLNISTPDSQTRNPKSRSLASLSSLSGSSAPLLITLVI
jgi:hypothetical protein